MWESASAQISPIFPNRPPSSPGSSTHLELVGLGLEKLLLIGLLGLLLLGEVGIVVLGNINTLEIDLGGGGDNVAGVDAAEGDTVDLEGAGDEDDTLLKGLEVDDALAAETTGEDDDDGTGDEGRADGGRADGLADLYNYSISVCSCRGSRSTPNFISRSSKARESSQKSSSSISTSLPHFNPCSPFLS